MLRANPYVLGVNLALSPLRCMGCLLDWVPSLTRPAGRSSPIGSLAGQLMQRWSDYVDHVVTIDHRPCRDRGTGLFVTDRSSGLEATTARPHILTMVNRLFEAPPPMHGPPAAQQAPSGHQAARARFCDSVFSGQPGLRFDRKHWPHFAGDFIRYEHMVLAAQRHLFDPHTRELTCARQRRLLLDGLVAPTTSLRREAAAAVGWAVSWLGASQALAPPTGFAAPAAGLTGRLARLPLRPRLTSLRAWREQVARWLTEDLAHSACLWSQVTEFMSTRGHSLLYGDASN